VIAGDVVDFLAEKTAGGFQSFTANDAVATDKLLSIIVKRSGTRFRNSSLQATR
jgi:hypothetical protein